MPARPRLDLDPRRFRLTFVAAFAIGQLLICAGFTIEFLHTRETVREAFEQRGLAAILVLEDHASRALDVVAARTTLAATLPGTAAPEEISRRLGDIAAGASIIRSLSLAGADGTIRASSDPAMLGARLPPGALPPSGTRDPAHGLSFGPAIDAPLAGAAPGARAPAWIASRAAQTGEPGARWVAAIDLSAFVELWTRVREDKAVLIAMFDATGAIIAATGASPAGIAPPGARIAAAARGRDRGLLGPDETGGMLVAFRASQDHPFVVAAAMDAATLARRHIEKQTPLAIAAVAATLLLSGALLMLYRWYLRYEASVIEMRNQALAIGEHVMVSEADAQGRIIDVNDAFLRACGYAREELIGRDHRILNSGHQTPEFYRALWDTILAGRVWHGTLRNRARSGDFYWVSATIIPFKDAWGKTLRYVALYSDVSGAVVAAELLARERRLRDELSAANKALLTHVHTDHLTGIANRRGFDRFADEFRARPDAAGAPVSVLMLDIDHFKRINDGWGHAAGDAVLREAAARWRRTLRGSDFIARLGGEEFCVILPRTPSPSALFVAHKLGEAMRAKPFEVQGPDGPVPIPVTVSIGIAAVRMGPGFDLQHAQDLADEALYRAKRNGRDRIEMHSATALTGAANAAA
jgi:diguanylate cyclase (GGDEF)-like protein/PAS domain S-box-containing protein